jgi:predicted metal-dependent peptidase
MIESAAKRIFRARTALVLDHPFFGQLALRLQPKESPAVTESMATDGRTLFYQAEYVMSLTHSELVGLFAHEVLHAALQHHTRRADRERKLWNEACDYAANPILRSAGFVLPSDLKCDDRYAGQSCEQIYTTLRELQTDEEGKQDETNADSGEQAGDGANGEGQGSSDPGPGGVIDSPDVTDAGEWQIAVRQATKAAQMIGKLPEALQRAVTETARPRIDSRSLLARFMQSCAAADYSWRQPNSRYVASGLYLPALRSEAMPPVVVIIDTSGSISEKDLELAAADINAIADECQPEAIHVIYADAKVQGMQTFLPGEQLKLEPRGGGGTHFAPAFAHIDNEALAPACAIYLTDGYGHYPEHAPEYPVLWLMTTDEVAPFGETVKLCSM